MSSTAALQAPIGLSTDRLQQPIRSQRSNLIVLILINARGARPTAIFGCHGSRAFHRR